MLLHILNIHFKYIYTVCPEKLTLRKFLSCDQAKVSQNTL